KNNLKANNAGEAEIDAAQQDAARGDVDENIKDINVIETTVAQIVVSQNALNKSGDEKPFPAESDNDDVGLGQEDGPVTFDSSGVVNQAEERVEDDARSATVKLCNKILKDAVRLRASDIHLEPRTKGMLTRYRVDGYLRSGLLTPKEVQPAV